MSPRSIRAGVALAAAFASLFAPATAQTSIPWSNHESHVVRPLAITPDGTKLLAVDTDAGRLSVFSLANPSVPTLLKEIPVGLEPVAVAARTNDEYWVVCSVSDSVCVVSYAAGAVVQTLATGDEPRDVVFAGSPLKAYVPCGTARRLDVFDAATQAALPSIVLDMWDPTAAVASKDGRTVYVLSRLSGNGTSIVPPGSVLPADLQQVVDPTAPDVGFITEHSNPNYASVFNFPLSDRDLALVSTTAGTVSYVDTVGTLNFQLALRPGFDELWVTNTEALNTTRFEPNLKGHFVDTLLTPVKLTAPPAVASPVDLNAGFAYGAGQTPANISTAVAQPMGLVFTRTGRRAYVASFGSDRVLELDMNGGPGITRIELRPNQAAQVDARNMRGPVGLALDEANDRLYVWNRVSRSISVVNTLLGAVTLELPLAGYHPVPAEIREGRGFLYDARLGNGVQSCASCHVAARIDGLGWDLGEPGGAVVTVPLAGGGQTDLHPMKGPMTTQTLQGLEGTEPFHWRGDRPDFNAFNPAFDGLLGGVQLAAADMQAYTDFIETVEFPANPHRTLDDQDPTNLFGLGADAAAGRTVFMSTTFENCNQCHSITNHGTNQVIQFELSSQPIKTAQMRSVYEKVPFAPPGFSQGPFQTGFGLFHDGRIRDTFAFMATFFGGLSPQEILDVAAFSHAFPTETPPAVGAARTIGPANWNDPLIAADVATLEAQAALGNCDLVVKTHYLGVPRGLWYDPSLPGPKKYVADTTAIAPLDYADIQVWATASSTTFIGVKAGTGPRVGIDRDLDGVLDADQPPPNAVSFFGAPTNGCCGNVTIALSGDPYLGNRFTAVTGTGAPANAAGFVILGTVADPGSSQFGVTIYVDLNDPATVVGNLVADETGTGAFQVPIPDDPSFQGVPFHFQLLWVDPAGPQGFSASERMTIVPYAP